MRTSFIKKHIYAFVGAIGLLAAGHTFAADNDQDLIKKGQYLAVAGDCIACHTANKEQPFAGGYKFSMPMGDIISTNITPSKTHGIGNFTEEQFSRAVREGVTPDGRALYPAMPYTEYTKITDEDMHALYVYFMQGVKPVDADPSEKTALKFPFNLPGTMKIWQAIYQKNERFQPDAGVSEQINRGKYLVDGLAHCATCHTPRNQMMAADNSQYLAGGVVGGWYAPNITSDEISGIGGWTQEELATYLKTGHAEGKAQAGGGMAEAIENSFRHLSDSDITAMAAYIKTVPAIRDAGQTQPAFAVKEAKPVNWTDYEQPVPLSNDPAQWDASKELNGAKLYNFACAACHGVNGQGTEDGDHAFPSLTSNTAVGSIHPNNLVMAISEGIHREGADGLVSMPAYARESERITSDLSPAQIAAVTNYVTAQFGHGDAKLTAADVETIQHGGELPFLIRHAATLFVAGVIIALMILVAVIAAVRRRRKA